ncbi:related to RTT109 - regulator of Ty1 transposition [Cephalotrichum gorgonifer]|uniref:histone acetyltransferase n=1 Tax=Cephalotrichum gorgonifer TaxID=2041049 RepID=A0AAE8MSK3_9PEZI|nr:related to RTT109 - regulator of Ty1 transposition [Cephalotrichum gorgonifer]
MPTHPPQEPDLAISPRPSSLAQRLVAVLPKGHTFGIYHLSTRPTRCEPLCPAPPGQRPDKTFCEKHLLAISIDSPGRRDSQTAASSRHGTDNTTQARDGGAVLVFALEIYIFTTAYSSTFFVSKADSTGYLHLLNLPRGTPSPIRGVATAFLSFLVERRRRRGAQCVVSLFARAQSQYLFPGSADNAGKHVLDDRGLVRWWCRALGPLVRDPPAGNELPPWARVRGYLVVPGLETNETRGYLPRGGGDWVLGHPLELISHYCKEHDSVPPRCLVPGFPDDPKARFRDELDEELVKSTKSPAGGSWRSVRSLEQFWDMMEFRQECSSGRLTGFIWVVFDVQETGPREEATTSSAVPNGSAGLDGTTRPSTTTRQPTAQEVPASSSSLNLVLSPKPGKRSSHSPTKPRGSSSGKTRKEKKKAPLTGPIRSRQPHIKTHASRAGVSNLRPSSCAYYHWPVEGRGEVLFDEKGYNRVMELLLNLDFKNLEMAVRSTARWVGEVGVGSTWGVNVVGTQEAPPPAEERAGAATGGPKVNDLAGLVKRKREGGGEVKVNVLGGGLVRKKPKPESSG